MLDYLLSFFRDRRKLSLVVVPERRTRPVTRGGRLRCASKMLDESVDRLTSALNKANNGRR